MQARSSHGARTLRRALPAALLGVLVAWAIVAGATARPALAITYTPTNSYPAATSVQVNAQASYATTATMSRANERLSAVTYTFGANTLVEFVTIGSVTVRIGATNYTASGLVLDTTLRTVHFHIDNFPASAIGVVGYISVADIVNPSQPGAYTTTANRPKVSIDSMVNTTTYTATSYKQTTFLVNNPGGLAVGTPTLTNYQTNTASAYSIPFTVGPLGRIAQNAAVGANTVAITFPAGTTVPTALVAGSVKINGVNVITYAGNNTSKTATLTVPTGVTVANGGAVTVDFASDFGLRSTTAGTKHLDVRTSAETALASSGNYTIVSAPALTMSVDTPSVDFGAVEPGAAPATHPVVVTVDSSAPFTLSRDLSGAWATMGLSVTGDANGSKSAGHGDYADTLTVALPWSTPAGTPLSASVTYTAIQ